MHFPTLLHDCDAPPVLVEIVTELMARKALTRELGSGPVPEPILTFIDAEFEEARKIFPRKRDDIAPERRERVEAFFQARVRR